MMGHWRVRVIGILRENNQAATERVQKWLSAQNSNDLVISDWVITEFSSALSIKLRSGQINIEHRAAALSMFTKLVADSFAVLPILPTHFRTAARFADQFTLGIRAGDALHLAIAAEHGATIHILDQRLIEAGTALGVRMAGV
jgi:predicted nucleic acid-binding protein